MRMNTDRQHSEQQTKQSRWGFRGMTLRDWLPIIGALLVPLVIALGTGWITWQLAQLENKRAEAERALAERQKQDEALQAYVDEVGRLMLEKNLTDPKVKTILRARTITVLGRLDPSEGRMPPSGKTAVMQFLVEAELVQRVEGRDPTIILQSADLREAYLFGANLFGATLSDADLSNADLSNASLGDADLGDARGWTMEQLSTAMYLEGATMPDGQTLRGDKTPNGPTFEEWRKDKEARK
jgi:Pentapeptide repeats (8 copies)